jgi:hypothetical protein
VRLVSVHHILYVNAIVHAWALTLLAMSPLFFCRERHALILLRLWSTLRRVGFKHFESERPVVMRKLNATPWLSLLINWTTAIAGTQTPCLASALPMVFVEDKIAIEFSFCIILLISNC